MSYKIRQVVKLRGYDLMKRCIGMQFDPHIVEKVIKVISDAKNKDKKDWKCKQSGVVE